MKRESITSAWGAAGIGDSKTTMGGALLGGSKDREYQELDRCAYEINP